MAHKVQYDLAPAYISSLLKCLSSSHTLGAPLAEHLGLLGCAYVILTSSYSHVALTVACNSLPYSAHLIHSYLKTQVNITFTSSLSKATHIIIHNILVNPLFSHTLYCTQFCLIVSDLHQMRRPTGKRLFYSHLYLQHIV